MKVRVRLGVFLTTEYTEYTEWLWGLVGYAFDAEFCVFEVEEEGGL